MAERAGEQPQVDLSKLLDPKKFDIEVKSSEKPEEIQSRLRREEAKEAHERKISLMVHYLVMAMVGVAFLTCVLIVTVKDQNTGLTDKAMGLMTAIISASVGYMTGKGSK
jgi:glycerol uptake facilitator-like aquaporin